MDVYDRIDELLKKKGISRRKAAQLAGIVPGTLNSALYRKKGLSAAAVSALAQALGVDANYLLNGQTLEQRDAEYVDKLKARKQQAEAMGIYLEGLSDEEIKAIDTIVHTLRKAKEQQAEE